MDDKIRQFLNRVSECSPVVAGDDCDNLSASAATIDITWGELFAIRVALDEDNYPAFPPEPATADREMIERLEGENARLVGIIDFMTTANAMQAECRAALSSDADAQGE